MRARLVFLALLICGICALAFAGLKTSGVQVSPIRDEHVTVVPDFADTTLKLRVFAFPANATLMFVQWKEGAGGTWAPEYGGLSDTAWVDTTASGLLTKWIDTAEADSDSVFVRVMLRDSRDMLSGWIEPDPIVINTETPVIYQCYGSAMADSTFAIGGGNFGVKDPAAPVLWDNFEGGVDGDSVVSPTIGSDWKQRTRPVTYSHDYAAGGSLSAHWQYTAGGSNAGGLACFWGNLVGPDPCYGTDSGVMIGKLMLRGGGVSSNAKIWRLLGHRGDANGDEPNVWMHGYPMLWWGKDRNAPWVFRASMVTETQQNIPVPNAAPVIVNTWRTVAFAAKDTTIDGLDATGWASFDSPLCSRTGLDCIESQCALCDEQSCHAPPGYGLNYGTRGFNTAAFFCYYSCEGSDSYDVYLDDCYVDSTLARIEIGNAATWAACTHREIQIPTAWNEGGVQFTVNQGTFADDEVAYVFLVNADGTVSNGCPIRWGSVVRKRVNEGGYDIVPAEE